MSGRGGFSCIYRGCSCKTGGGVSLFSLPKDAQRSQMWLKASNREDLLQKDVDNLHKNYRLCEYHFEEKNILCRKKRKILSVDAVPTVFSYSFKRSATENTRSEVPPKKIIIDSANNYTRYKTSLNYSMSKKYSNLPTCLPLPLPEDELEELFQKAIDWAIMNGVSMRSKINFSKDTVQVAPFTLLPSPIPKKEFEKVVEIQTVFNELMHRVAHNRQFLTRCLKDTIQVDEFTGNLFKIYETVMDEGISQPISLGLFRADYMINNDSLKQVEINTIASSFAGIATVITKYNRYILQELGHEDKINNLPENKAISGLSEGIVEAWKLYGNKNSVILFLVENVSFNICDQRFVEFEIRKLHPNVKIIRRTLTDVGERGSLSSSKELIIDKYTVAVIYYRSGYEPPQYPSKKEWDARLLMERSLAIKCPSIQYHLAGTKKVQQALTTSGALELFLSEAKKIEAIKEVFVGLYGLDFDELGNQAVQMALEDPERFVLKPQREGGGNNVYGPDIRDAMLIIKDSKERTAWILMERIRPPVLKGYIVRAGLEKLPQLMELVSEVGIFGVVMGDQQKLMINKQVGHMLRTKAATEDEGGVAAGAGALDGPYLLE